jgi:hypothetical protein
MYGGEEQAGFWLQNLTKRPLGRPRHRCENNFKMNLQENVWGAWTGLVWPRIRKGGRLL